MQVSGKEQEVANLISRSAEVAEYLQLYPHKGTLADFLDLLLAIWLGDCLEHFVAAEHV